MARSQRKPATPKRLTARIKVWLELDGEYVFGFGLSEILKAVEAAGSIKGAAGRMGKSYRYVWGRIKKAEDAIGEPLVSARVGGKGADRSSLNDLARRLVAEYDALRQRMRRVVSEEFSNRFDAPGGE